MSSAPLRRPLDGWHEPADVYRAVAAHRPYAVWRDAGIFAQSGRSFIGLTGAEAGLVTVAGDGEGPDGLDGVGTCSRTDGSSPERGVLAALTDALRHGLQGHACASGSLGWWGWFGYESACGELGVPAAGADSPAAAFLFVDRGIEFDHASRTVSLVGLAGAPDVAAWFERMAELIGGGPRAVASEHPGVAGRSWSWRHDRERYLAMIDACQDAISRGDAFQLCLTNTIDVELDPRADPLEVYLRLRAISPTSHGGLLRFADWSLLSGSPEQFVRVDAAGRAATHPIKGTRPRGHDRRHDDALVADLLTSEKERAENVMIVDLMRNDLSAVSVTGTVAVTRLFAVESYPHFHQLVSTVEADLAVDGLAAAVALFPPGSMTGAPKRSAMTILAALERGPRGLYSGVWGCFAVDGSVDLAVVIRSIVMVPGRATIGAGGGITILSDPVEEWDEVVLKAGPALSALGLDAPDRAASIRKEHVHA